jgi:hypothetical protein
VPDLPDLPDEIRVTAVPAVGGLAAVAEERSLHHDDLRAITTTLAADRP